MIEAKKLSMAGAPTTSASALFAMPAAEAPRMFRGDKRGTRNLKTQLDPETMSP